MKLYLLEQDVSGCSEGSDFHYNTLLNHPDVTVLQDVSDFPFDGIFFQNVNTINMDTSCIYDPKFYSPSYLIETFPGSDSYLLLNNDIRIVNYEQVKECFVQKKIFVKPHNVLKGFTPTCLNAGDRFLSLNLRVNQDIAVFPFKDIHNSIEYRCVVVDNQLVSIVNTQENKTTPPEAYIFVERVVLEYLQDVSTYVLDILFWRDFYLVVEINPLETSGFFDNYERIINSLKNLE